MAAESEDDQLSVQLPPDLEAWLDEQASEQGLERERLLQRLLEASRLVIAEAGTDTDVDLGALSDRVETLDDEIDALTADLDALDTVDERIEDVRNRVVQVKRETDAKAPADHRHDEFDEIDGRIGELADAVSETRANVEELRGAVDSHDEQFESVTDRLHQVAAAIVGLRETVEEFERDERLMELKSTAARRGFQKADCGGCGRKINLAVLTTAACPRCEMSLHDVTGNNGLFSTPTLVGEDEA